MALDYVSLGEDVKGIIDELGAEISVLVPSSTSKNTTGKSVKTYTTYTGMAVRKKYDSEFVTKDSIVQAGDVGFVCYFDNTSFEPMDKKNQIVIFGELKYTIISVQQVAPSSVNVLVYIIQARRIN